MGEGPVDHITVCICTYKRPGLLGRLLEKLAGLRTDGLFSVSAVVVDNDVGESGRATVEALRLGAAVGVRYLVEPERNISLARNRSVDSASGDMIAFIDDDEFPDPDWLINLFRALKASTAAGVLGPVKPYFEEGLPDWLVRSGLLERRAFRTGQVLRDAHDTRTGNVLLRRSLFEDPTHRFDPAYGRTGGGDAVFFKRMMEKGETFIWCNEAVAYETIQPERRKKSYYIKRAFTRGMTEAQATPFLSFGTLRSLVAVPLYALALPVALLVGQHVFIRILVSACDHLSKILCYLGIRLVRERPY